MPSEKLEKLLSQLSGVVNSNGQYRAICPSHEDNKASLAVRDGKDGITLFCFAGCELSEVLAAIGWKLSELWYKDTSSNYNLTKHKSSKSQNPKRQSSLFDQEQESVKEENSLLTSKRSYASLTEYAAFKGLSEQVFLDAGWSFLTYRNRPALSIQTDNGLRYRFLDNNGNTFESEKGFQKCWYRLTEALELSKKYNRSVIICNGEPSVVVAQSVNLPATCICSGEGVNFSDDLLLELSLKYNESIILALDCDNAGKKGTIKRLEKLKEKGFFVRAIDFNSEQKGYDLADFVKENSLLSQEKIYQKLLNLPTFDPDLEKNTKAASKHLEQDLQYQIHQDGLGNFSDIFSLYFTEINAAYRFVAQHSQSVRYCHPWKTWLYWDGAKWIEDKIGEIFRRALFTSLSILEEAKNLPCETDAQKDRKEKMFKHAMSFQNRAKIKNMIEIAKNAPSIYVLPEQFDNDIWILNCQNGVLNLKTAELEAHNPKNYISKISNTNYNKEAKCPTWLAFLDKIMNKNANLISFLQKAIGHSLTGDTMEKALFFFYGHAGDNGKSTFLETISAMLGSYALAKFPVAALLEDHQNSISNNPAPNIAQLQGVRFVTASELGGNKKLNEETIKDLTGGIDSISAKRLYENPFTFKPTHKFFIYGNDKPYIPNNSKAMWNRLKTIPFTISIPSAEQDKNLGYKLAQEMPGILAWAVQGCIDWQKEGLGIPQEIIDANQAYKEEIDTIGHYIKEECIIGSGYKILSKDLYAHYSIWSKKNGHHALNQNNFGKELRNHGLVNYSGTGGYSTWRDLSLIEVEEIKELKEKLKTLNKQFPGL